MALFKNKAEWVGRFHISFQLQSLQSENTSLRRQATTNTHPAPGGSEYTDVPSVRRPSLRSSRPMSMYETGSTQKPYLPLTEASYPEERIAPRLQLFHVSSAAALLPSGSPPVFSAATADAPLLGTQPYLRFPHSWHRGRGSV